MSTAAPGRGRHRLAEHPRPLGRLSDDGAVMRGRAVARPDDPGAIRGHPDLRRLEPEQPTAGQARRHRLRLAHEYAHSGPRPRARAHLRAVVLPAPRLDLWRWSRGQPATREVLD